MQPQKLAPITEVGCSLQKFTKMESRMNPIQEGEDDEDITMLDMSTPSSFSSCNSSPTQLPRHSWIQQICS